MSKEGHFRNLAGNEEVVRNMAEVIELSFIKHLQGNFPSFKDVKRGFPKREQVSEDLMIITEVCFYPDHSKSLQKLYVCRKNNEWKVLSTVD